MRATLSTRSEPKIALSNQVAALLRGYEEFMVQQDIPGVSGYVMTLRTNLMVHIKHTRKNVFRPHSVYQATSMTALPNKAFMEAWLKNAREAATKFINKGDYTDEKLVAGEWQSWKRKFNQWIYYDRKLGALTGQVQLIDLVATSPDTNSSSSNPPSQEGDTT